MKNNFEVIEELKDETEKINPNVNVFETIKKNDEEEFEKNNNKRKIVIFTFIFMFAITAAIGVRTFTKFVQSRTSSATPVVAAWQFNNDNNLSTFTVNLADTYVDTTLVGNKIAPGTSGSFSINVSNANTQVGTHYKIKFNTSTLPDAFRLYADKEWVVDAEEPEGGYWDYTYPQSEYDWENDINYSYLEGNLAPGANIDRTIIWEWEYNTFNGCTGAPGDSDGNDTSFAGTNLSISGFIDGEQILPE